MFVTELFINKLFTPLTPILFILQNWFQGVDFHRRGFRLELE